MTTTKKLPRAKRSIRTTRAHQDDGTVPTDDTPLALLQAQLERVEAALVAERNAHAAEVSASGEMLARVARGDDRARVAEEAVERAVAEAEAQRTAAAELEESVGRLWRELGTVRRELELRTEQLHKAEATALEKVRAASTAAKATSEGSGVEDDVSSLRTQLEEARAESRRMRENFETLQTRAGKIGAGLREMRELMVQSAALFDDLEEREKAIGEIRARSMREARALFLRAAGQDHEVGRPPPLPGERAPVEDLSEAAELLEEEVRSSMRPPAERGEPRD